MRILSLLTIVLVLTACGSDSTSPTAPGVEPEVLNNPDAFQFQLSSIESYTGTLNYTWINSGVLANIDQSSSIEPGQATLTLLDSDGVTVYSRDLAEDGSTATDPGAAGSWRVRVTCTGLSGTVNFRAEKRTP
jgi:hypothetical protein